MDVKQIVSEQKKFFDQKGTRDIEYRIRNLEKLRDAIKRYEPDIVNAIKKDLNKSEFDTYLTEIGFVLSEIKHTIKHLRRWAKPERVGTSKLLLGSKSTIYKEPYGVTLIISPWNYPFQLLISPLVGAIAAGNCIIMKPSEFTPHVSQCIGQMIEGIFDPHYITVIEGDAEVSQAIMKEPIDHIFFTGSVPVGRIIMAEAAKTLTPLVLELGGKSPAIVECDANLKLTAKRLVWGKFVNAGQTCVAPDYLLVHERVKDELLVLMKEAIIEFYGDKPLENENYTHIVNERHFDRLAKLLEGENEFYWGGDKNREALSIEPTIIDGVDWKHITMEDEIFGPILPVLTFNDLDKAVAEVKQLPKPLALYIFSEDRRKQQFILESVPYGGGCINDTLIHLATPHLPFGGIGPSGMGAYHGKFSFDAFTHQKGIVKQTTRFDVPVRYPSFKDGLKWLKKLL
ncbi:aldehyde dehydrogenase [Hazenella sp. IB182357]|uniref:Aldehyde dehydrogenase n=1 Tax=Polycladospora coralii TaxID=2771432 RepID=A0A926NCQ4_9BACL|nr:aldehyde dehydrogenase [Polycladospora coralii]MBD1371028.1 aldehyde dehydrogenase [Polycladospora coralii]MBS7529968.1 aldehyde dehydrogenase [Polycladospora coralii]